ncbi:MAG: LPS assembly lipoprotein LptE [Saprospiraceae bacterium]
MRVLVGLLLYGVMVLASCGNNGYSLRGISIPNDVTTYYVEQFRNNALNAPPTLAIEVAEALKEKIRRESRLVLNDTSPDVEFKGTVVDFRVTAEAPQPGGTTAVNRLTIVTSVEYINNKKEEDGFKKNFTFFYDFPASTDLTAVQSEAIEAILAQITEDVFNAAFTNW